MKPCRMEITEIPNAQTVILKSGHTPKRKAKRKLTNKGLSSRSRSFRVSLTVFWTVTSCVNSVHAATKLAATLEMLLGSTLKSIVVLKQKIFIMNN